MSPRPALAALSRHIEASNHLLHDLALLPTPVATGGYNDHRKPYVNMTGRPIGPAVCEDSYHAGYGCANATIARAWLAAQGEGVHVHSFWLGYLDGART